MNRRALLSSAGAAALGAAVVLFAAATPAAAADITLRGASQFGDEHPFTQTLQKFADLVEEYYQGDQDVEFVLHKNSELGLEKDYFNYMSQGTAVDYAIVAPSHMSTFSQKAPLMDMPFLFCDLTHWNAVMESDALEPIAEDVYETADVMLIGYAGGGTRNLIVNRPVTNMQELSDLPIRVMGAPIQTRIFEALGAAPTVIAYDEVYNAIQTGVIDAAENEAMGLEQMKFYEVGPEIGLTQHAITVRPLAFSGKTFRNLPKDLQDAVLRAGAEASRFGRELESTGDQERLARLEEEGLLQTHAFTERQKLLEAAEPVKQAYAEELGASDVLQNINALGDCTAGGGGTGGEGGTGGTGG